jgi:hypothetical protein
MEHWLNIHEFPGYSVSNTGYVRNDDTGRIMTVLVNQRGIAYVGLMKRGVQHKRSVAILVTSAYLPKPKLEAFDTPINLDGDRLNNHIDNLTIRPRWFATKYFQQFNTPPQGIATPIEEVQTGERFENSWEAATKFGLLDKDILMAVMNETYVWPTFQYFRKI